MSLTERWLLHAVDAGLLAVIFVAPLFMGGRGDVGKLALLLAVAWTAAAWTLRQCLSAGAIWRWSGAEWLLLAGLGWLAVQLAPLPASWLHDFSPELVRLLPLWFGESHAALGLGDWNQLTLSPAATRGGLVMFLTYCLLFLVAVQRLGKRRDVERLLKWLALSAVAMAGLGLAQLCCGNGKFLWIFEHPTRDTFGAVKGAFQNQNHFAHFVILGLGPLLWWLHEIPRLAAAAFRTGRNKSGGELQRPLLGIGIGLCVLAVLLTFSRGGVIALAAAAATAFAIYFRLGMVGRRSVLALCGLALLLVGVLAIHGYEPLARKLGTLTSSDSLADLSRGRNALWKAHLAAIPRFAWTGAGVGSHREIYRTYITEHFNLEFTHGENGYLHLLLEAGVPGLTLLLIGWGYMLGWSLAPLRGGGSGEGKSAAGRKIPAAILPGFAASLVHSLGDFVWYIPACVSLTILLAACACRWRQIAAGEDAAAATTPTEPLWWRWFVGGRAQVERLVGFAAAVFVLAISALMLSERLPPAHAALCWHEYFKLSREAAEAGPNSAAALENEPASDEAVEAMALQLEDLLRRDPDNGRAHLRLASLCLRRFEAVQKHSENPLTLAQLRDAALASNFPTVAAQNQWLAVATGEHLRLLHKALWHTRRGLRLGPLQGEGYVYLAELAFLEGAPAEAKAALLDQALAVRPNHALVMMAAGQEAALAGDLEQALKMWKRAFHQDQEQQAKLIELLAPQMPGEVFLEQFAPDVEGLRLLYSFYREANREDDARAVGAAYAIAAEIAAGQQPTEVAAAKMWDRAADVHEFLGQHPQARHCAEAAVKLSPQELGYRRELIAALLKTKDYDRAAEEIQWCLARHPDDERLKQQWERVAKLRIADRGEAAALQ